jgi:hypothetical protein
MARHPLTSVPHFTEYSVRDLRIFGLTNYRPLQGRRRDLRSSLTSRDLEAAAAVSAP